MPHEILLKSGSMERKPFILCLATNPVATSDSIVDVTGAPPEVCSDVVRTLEKIKVNRRASSSRSRRGRGVTVLVDVADVFRSVGLGKGERLESTTAAPWREFTTRRGASVNRHLRPSDCTLMSRNHRVLPTVYSSSRRLSNSILYGTAAFRDVADRHPRRPASAAIERSWMDDSDRIAAVEPMSAISMSSCASQGSPCIPSHSGPLVG